MNIFANIFFVFLFLLTLFMFRIVNVSSESYIMHKVIIFTAVFFYQLSLVLVTQIRSKCKIEMDKIISSALQMGLFAVIGYSIFIDMKYMPMTRHTTNLMLNSRSRSVYVSLMMTVTIAVIKSIQLMFKNNYTSCDIN